MRVFKLKVLGRHKFCVVVMWRTAFALLLLASAVEAAHVHPDPSPPPSPPPPEPPSPPPSPLFPPPAPPGVNMQVVNGIASGTIIGIVCLIPIVLGLYNKITKGRIAHIYESADDSDCWCICFSFPLEPPPKKEVPLSPSQSKRASKVLPHPPDGDGGGTYGELSYGSSP